MMPARLAEPPATICLAMIVLSGSLRHHNTYAAKRFLCMQQMGALDQKTNHEQQQWFHAVFVP